MPKNKSNIEKAIGKLISSIQKEWDNEAGLPESEDSFDVMGLAHNLLQAKTPENINKILNDKDINEYLGTSWVDSHPSVNPEIQMLELAIADIK